MYSFDCLSKICPSSFVKQSAVVQQSIKSTKGEKRLPQLFVRNIRIRVRFPQRKWHSIYISKTAWLILFFFFSVFCSSFTTQFKSGRILCHTFNVAALNERVRKKGISVKVWQTVYKCSFSFPFTFRKITSHRFRWQTRNNSYISDFTLCVWECFKSKKILLQQQQQFTRNKKSPLFSPCVFMLEPNERDKVECDWISIIALRLLW